MVEPKKILLGVTGCIAAYKSCEIVRGLQKAGVDVEVVMTESATEFVGATTFAALTGRPVRTSTFGDLTDAIPHIRLAESCDLLLIAPCTANVLAKVACGVADDLLTSTALAAHDHLMVAPAMNMHMYESPATQANLTTLAERGVALIEPASGRLACGDVGQGKLAPVEDIVAAALAWLDGRSASRADAPTSVLDLLGKRVLVTAGPTRERIDPVRYLTNDSSGKMGYALAEAAARRGAEVTLVSGPVALEPPSGINVIPVESADEMFAAAREAFPEADIAIFAAAVADVRPKERAGHKLKKGVDDKALRTIELEENPDILATLAAAKRPGQVVIGFAAETDDLIANARKKFASKHADLIVANEVGQSKAFAQDAMTVALVTSDAASELPHSSKREIAATILDWAHSHLANNL